ncbi:MAG: helix-turn-helix domain-containing protein [Candidatus Dojkabacteria bacterium]|nr:helix-turn-helix domain-containing protein [Candidatus Dojkabacteria bacterium]
MDLLKVIKILKQLGLDEKEIEIYLETLKSPSLSTTQLSRKTKIPKTSIYRYVESLIRKGILEKVVGVRGMLIKAKNPGNLEMILTGKIDNLKKVEHVFPEMLGYLNSIQANKRSKTEVLYFEGRSGIKQLLWNTLRAEGKEPVVGYGCRTWNDYVGRTFAEKLRFEYIRRGIHNKEIQNSPLSSKSFTDVKQYIDTNYRMHTIPKSKMEINYNTIIYDKFFSFYSMHEDEIFGIEIKNTEIARSQRQIFELIWEGLTR